MMYIYIYIYVSPQPVPLAFNDFDVTFFKQMTLSKMADDMLQHFECENGKLSTE